MTIELLNCDCMEYMKGCEDNDFDLIIADPPYYEIEGGFDFKWNNFGEYLTDVEKWAKEISRVLKDSGTLFWWGDEKNIAYSQIILDKRLTLVNSLVWYKYNLRGGMFGSAGGDSVRSFPICTERALMYSKDTYNLTSCITNIRDYIRFEIEKSKGVVSLKDINSVLGTATNGGGVASACLSLSKSEPAMMTKEMYTKLQEWCAPFMRAEYEELRAEYEELRRPFNNSLNLTEVLIFDQPTTGAIHPTQKARKLTEALIRTTARQGESAFIPFMGSGTEAIECFNYGLRVVATEIDEQYYSDAVERFNHETAQLDIFA